MGLWQDILAGKGMVDPNTPFPKAPSLKDIINFRGIGQKADQYGTAPPTVPVDIPKGLTMRASHDPSLPPDLTARTINNVTPTTAPAKFRSQAKGITQPVVAAPIDLNAIGGIRPEYEKLNIPYNEADTRAVQNINVNKGGNAGMGNFFSPGSNVPKAPDPALLTPEEFDFRKNISSYMENLMSRIQTPKGPKSAQANAAMATAVGHLANVLGGTFGSQNTDISNRLKGEAEARSKMDTNILDRAKMEQVDIPKLAAKIEFNKGKLALDKEGHAINWKNAQTAANRQGDALEIATLKANSGKYGDTATAAEFLKGIGIPPTPAAIDIFSKNGKFVPPVPAKKGWFRKSAGVPGHMIPGDWVPTGKYSTDGVPVYKDAAGNLKTPDIYSR